jgi:hypothetical protein
LSSPLLLKIVEREGEGPGMPRKRELEEGWTSLATACAIIEAPLQKMGEETGDGERERREVSQTRGTHVGPTLT